MNSNFQINSILKKFKTGNRLESYRELQKVFSKNKNNNLLRYNLAVMQQKLHFNEEARINYNFLIKNENNFKAMINLYNLDIVEAKYFEALNMIERILKIKQIENVDKDRAFVLCKLNRIEDSKKICIFYLKNNNKDLHVLNIIGQCFFHEENYDEAIKIFKNILTIDQENLSALNSLGRIFQEKRDRIKAEEYYLKALKVSSSSFFVLNNIAGFYREELEHKKAINFYRRALLVNPNNPYIYNNLSKIYFDLNNHEEAMKNSFKALQMKGNDGDIKKTISLIYLKDHDFEKGWSYFDGRLDLNYFIKKSDYVNKLNSKLYLSDVLNRNINKFLVVREQGVGDEILYSSMYGDFLNDIQNVAIECDPRLINIFKKSFPKHSDKFVEIGNITNNNEKFNQIDFVLYAGSLGKYYRKNINDFQKYSFLKIDQKKIEEMKSRLSKYKKKYKVGISWKSFKNRYAVDKSLKLSDFIKIFSYNNCDIFNLQYGNVTDEIINFNVTSNNKLINVAGLDLYNDFEGIASLLKSLDVFITISNSTAHLAGSLGVKTVLIKPENYAVFHYWNQKGNKTPWYNCVELVDRESFLKGYINLQNYLTL